MVSGSETDQRLDKAADLLNDLIVVSKEIVVELKGSREDIKGVHEVVQDVRQEVNNIGEMLGEKIDDAKDEIANEVKELHSDLRDDRRAVLSSSPGSPSNLSLKPHNQTI